MKDGTVSVGPVLEVGTMQFRSGFFFFFFAKKYIFTKVTGGGGGTSWPLKVQKSCKGLSNTLTYFFICLLSHFLINWVIFFICMSC